ncbi:MAG: DUF1846 domain-containing protein [Candidatus Micrarchaeota archaeon]
MLIDIGFDTKKYVEEQARFIIERAAKFDKKLYLEFGGKLLFDFHAMRVLPGYEPNAKMEILLKLKKQLEIVFCVSAKDIQEGRIAGTFGITYRDFTLKCIDDLKGLGLEVSTVVINLFSGEPSAKQLGDHLKSKGFKVYFRKMISGYPNDTEKIASEEGFGAKPYFETEKPIVIVTGAGPGSGKMATCLAMVYQDTIRGKDSGYAKFETFPIWNLSLKHPVNVAYEAATANISDYNMVDPYHLKAYGKESINYNRDVENFAIIQKILQAIISKDNHMHTYKSPTDMGVNMAKLGIVNEALCAEASKQEIVCRYFKYKADFIRGIEKKNTLDLMEKIMAEVNLGETYRKPVLFARESAKEAEAKGKGHDSVFCGSAIQLADGRVVSGKNSPLFHSESAMLLNALKVLGDIPDEAPLISKEVIDEIKNMKKTMLSEKSANLSLEETLMALAISAAKDKVAKHALEQLKKLKGTEMHSTCMLDRRDEGPLRKLGVNTTTDGLVPITKLYLD